MQKKLGDGPDLRVNQRLQMFTSLASLDNLKIYYEKKKTVVSKKVWEAHGADWTKKLVEKLGNFTSHPAAAGLGALAIAVFIDVLCYSPPEESTKDALRSVFAEEKASEVWDQINECLKRYIMNFNNRDELVSDIKWTERHLSAAITKLKNSMVRDGHMSNQALRAWVNGAAFHVQMLIHLVRLGAIKSCDPAETLISAYQRDLDLLFEKHEEVIKGKCQKKGFLDTYLVDEESKEHDIPAGGHYKTYLEAYYNHRYGPQKCEIQQYFSDVRQNLQKLVGQRGYFAFFVSLLVCFFALFYILSYGGV